MIQECRVCQGKLEQVLDLGSQQVINFGDKPQKNGDLVLMLCKSCSLVQLRDTVEKDALFRHYYYKSGVNQSMKDSLSNVVKNIERRMDLSKGDRVVDIGANDGTLLGSYTVSGLEKVAFEPAADFQDELKHRATDVIGDFFSADKMMGLKAKVITAVAMFYDLEDPNAFVADVAKVLDRDGIFVIQQNYLPAMLENNAFDNIVHEHLEYYSVTSLKYLLLKNKLWLFHVEFNDVNGGSFRAYVQHLPEGFDDIPSPTGAATLPSVYEAIDREEKLGLGKPEAYREFAVKVDMIKRKIHDFVAREVAAGKTFYIAGASTRGNTLIQTCELQDLIQYAVERNPTKWGTTYCGKIRVISEKTAQEIPPDYYLLLPWHFFSEFVLREQEFLKRGGKLLVPLPKPYVLEAKNL